MWPSVITEWAVPAETGSVRTRLLAWHLEDAFADTVFDLVVRVTKQPPVLHTK